MASSSTTCDVFLSQSDENKSANSDKGQTKTDWDAEKLHNAKPVWDKFATGADFETIAEECGGAGDCFFHCVAVGFFRAAEFTRSQCLRKKYKRGFVGMNATRCDFASTVTVHNALALAESLVDGAISDNCSVQWLRALKSAMKHAQAATDEDDSALVQLQECLRKMIETPGTYFQGTDLLLRHYVSYAKDYMSSVTTSPASARVTDMKSWTEASLPDVGFLVMIDAYPGICELIGGLHKRFYIVLVNYGNMHWRLGYVRTREDREDDPDAPFYCVIERALAVRILEMSDQARRNIIQCHSR